MAKERRQLRDNSTPDAPRNFRRTKGMIREPHDVARQIRYQVGRRLLRGFSIMNGGSI